jgi:hypothetical protein
MLVEIAVAVTLAPGIMALLGSVAIPEMEPVISARAEIEPNVRTAIVQSQRTLLGNNFTGPTS